MIPARRRATPALAAGAIAAFAWLASAAPAASTPDAAPGPVYDVLLRGGRIVDGTGNPWFTADLALRGDRIAAIGRLADAPAKKTLDVRGLVVAPGFIDLLGQSEYTALVDPHVRSKITQGITTELTGEGGSVAPQTPFTIGELLPTISDLDLTIDWRELDGYLARLRRKGSALNFAHLVGATQVRMAVLKSDNRAPTPREMEAMKRHVARAMEQGAFGLSSSLIYTPATFATTDELVELARVAAGYGGFYASHIRNESSRLVPAIEEAALIGERAGLPVEIWHFKSAGKPNWGRIGEGIEAIEAARARGVDVTADMYPYPAAATDLSACLPPWAQEGGLQSLVARLRDPEQRGRIREAIQAAAPDWEDLYQEAGPDGILVVGVKKQENKKYQGMHLAQIAKDRGADPFDALFDLLADEGGTVACVYFLMSEEDVRAAITEPWVAFDCDASGVRPDGVLGATMTHPRAYGTFPRVLGRYVREEKILRLEDAVRKMTSLPARRLGIRDRGLLRAGLYADLVVFDPDKVIDRATFEAPHQYAEGIVHVFVNGQAVVESGRVTEKLPGRILRGPGYKPAP
jgi:N-acyl-D-amino-acid deacylase